MQKEDVDKRQEEQLERMIVYAFQNLLLEKEYMLSYAMAQDLYNKICGVLLLVPTAITYVK